MDDHGDDLRAVIPPSPTLSRHFQGSDFDAVTTTFTTPDTAGHATTIAERDIADEKVSRAPSSTKGWTQHGEEYEVPIYHSPDGNHPFPLRTIKKCGVGPRHVPIEQPIQQVKPTLSSEEFDFDNMNISPGSSVHGEDEGQGAVEEVDHLAGENPGQHDNTKLLLGKLDLHRDLTRTEGDFGTGIHEGPANRVPVLRQNDNDFGHHESREPRGPVHPYSPRARTENSKAPDQPSAPQPSTERSGLPAHGDRTPERTKMYRTDRRGTPCVIEPPKTSQKDWTSVAGGIICDGKRCMAMSLADLSRSVRFIVNSKASEEVGLALMTGAVQPEPTLSLSEFLTSTESSEDNLIRYPTRPIREDSSIKQVRAPTPPGLYGKRALNLGTVPTWTAGNLDVFNRSWILHQDLTSGNIALIPETQLDIKNISFGISIPVEAIKYWLVKQYQHPAWFRYTHDHPYLSTHLVVEVPASPHGPGSLSNSPARANSSVSARPAAKSHRPPPMRRTKGVVDRFAKRLTTVPEVPSETHSSTHHDSSSENVADDTPKTATTRIPQRVGTKSVRGGQVETRYPSSSELSSPESIASMPASLVPASQFPPVGQFTPYINPMNGLMMYPYPTPSTNTSAVHIHPPQLMQPLVSSSRGALEPNFRGFASPFRQFTTVPNVTNGFGYASRPYHRHDPIWQLRSLAPPGNQHGNTIQSIAFPGAATSEHE